MKKLDQPHQVLVSRAWPMQSLGKPYSHCSCVRDTDVADMQ